MVVSSFLVRFIITTTILTAFSLGSIAQSTWRSGKVYLLDGNVLDGQINDLENRISPKYIEYKGEDGSIRTYKPNEIKGYATDRNVLYRGTKVTYDNEPQRYGLLPLEREPTSYITEELFVQVLVDGIYSLLTLTDAYDRVHFFIESNGKVEELLNRMYSEQINANAVPTNAKFRQQINLVTNNCPEVQRQVGTLSYKESVLVRVFKLINSCNNYEVKPPWSSAVKLLPPDKGVMVGIYRTGLKINFVGDFSGPKMDPIVGLYYERFSKKSPLRYSNVLELSYFGTNQILVNKVDAKYQSIIGNGMFRVAKPIQGGRIYFGFGASMVARFGIKLKTANGKKVFGDGTSDFNYGVFFSTGGTFYLVKQKFNLEVRYLPQLNTIGSESKLYSTGLGLVLQTRLGVGKP